MLEKLKENPKVEKIFGIRFDSSFKHYLKEEEHFKKLLKDLFHEEVDEIICFKDQEFPKDNINLRCCRSDLIVETDSNIMLVELQNKYYQNFKKRVRKYVSLLYTTQNDDGDYENIKPVKTYLILNYRKDTSKTLEYFSELEEKLRKQFDDLCDIKVFNIREALKEDKNSLEYKYARLFTLDELSKEVALKVLEKYQKDEELKYLVDHIIMYNLDIENYQRLKEESCMYETWESVTDCFKREGIEIGEKRGEKRGKEQERKEIVSNMLAADVPLDLISRVTKVPESKIRSYVNS